MFFQSNTSYSTMSSALRRYFMFHRRYFHQICELSRTCEKTLSFVPCYNCSEVRKNVNRKHHTGQYLRWNFNSIASICCCFNNRQYSRQGVEKLSLKDNLVHTYVKHLHETYEHASQVLSSCSTDAQFKDVQVH